jgi:ribosome-associated protein
MTDPVSPSDIDRYIRAVIARKAGRVVVLDVSELTSIADAFILCSGRSNRQVTAIAEYIEADLKSQGVRPLSVEGRREGHWVLMDYGDVVIHIFYEPVREVFDLEGLWIDAGRIVTDDMRAEAEAANEANEAEDDDDHDD